MSTFYSVGNFQRFIRVKLGTLWLGLGFFKLFLVNLKWDQWQRDRKSLRKIWGQWLQEAFIVLFEWRTCMKYPIHYSETQHCLFMSTREINSAKENISSLSSAGIGEFDWKWANLDRFGRRPIRKMKSLDDDWLSSFWFRTLYASAYTST